MDVIKCASQFRLQSKACSQTANHEANIKDIGNKSQVWGQIRGDAKSLVPSLPPNTHILPLPSIVAVIISRAVGGAPLTDGVAHVGVAAW